VQVIEDLFEPVLKDARAWAEDDCRQSSSVTMDDALHVYKILLLDASSVKEAGLAPQALKSGFRGLAKSLHPDKNRHPLSKEAF